MVHMSARLAEKNSDIYNVEETANAESAFAVSLFFLPDVLHRACVCTHSSCFWLLEYGMCCMEFYMTALACLTFWHWTI